jgi:hypothetical protein
LIDHAQVMAALKAHLAAVEKSAGVSLFSTGSIFGGAPLGLPLGGPHAAIIYQGRDVPAEGPRTLGNRMVDEQWAIGVFWPVIPERGDAQEAQEIQIANAHRDIAARLHGDSTLGGLVSRTEWSNGDVAFGQFWLPGGGRGPMYRSLDFAGDLTDLNAEDEAP